MTNKEHKLTVDDLIVEYMIYKVNNGYKPSFTTSEFISFLYFFERKMPVDDVIYENYPLFKRFFERKAENDWYKIDLVTNQKQPNPHMNMEYSDLENDYIISSGYNLGSFDKSVINTYYWEFVKSPKTVKRFYNIIGEYLANEPKRIIDETTVVDENEIEIGKYLAAQIVMEIWNSYIDVLISNRRWPEQCRDINRYLLSLDLAKIIKEKSIKNELLDLYKTLAKRIAILYHNDHNLMISTYDSKFLARANYELLIKGYEKLMNFAFRPFGKNLEFDLSCLTFTESHKKDGIYYYDEDEDPEVVINTTQIGNDNVRKLVKSIEKSIK